MERGREKERGGERELTVLYDVNTSRAEREKVTSKTGRLRKEF